jgi:hypothetical protein
MGRKTYKAAFGKEVMEPLDWSWMVAAEVAVPQVEEASPSVGSYQTASDVLAYLMISGLAAEACRLPVRPDGSEAGWSDLDTGKTKA